ncbi:MAG: hypothetical protein WAV07_09115 [Candidatus Contendobacter sp.]
MDALNQVIGTRARANEQQAAERLAERAGELAAHTTQQEVDDAHNRLSVAQGELTRAMVNEQAEALEKRLHEMEALLCKGISQLVQLKRQANPRFVAVASQVYQLAAPLDRFAKYGQIPG